MAQWAQVGFSDGTVTIYKIGGSIPAQASCYVVRSADRELENFLRVGGFCYILTARQMGKSSLRLRVQQKLTAAGVACAAIDLTGIGSTGVSSQQWHNSIAYELANRLGLTQELIEFSQHQSDRSAVQRLTDFIDNVVLHRIATPIVIFIDEIDKVIGLGDFTDDFFGAIRSIAERSSIDANYQRLSFVLLGVARPNDLIANKEQTPFNIGREITLGGFQTTDDLSPLMAGLAGRNISAHQTMTEILQWTNGQPLLTQKLCDLAANSPDLAIADIVRHKILENWESQDPMVHFTTIRNRLLAAQHYPAYSLERYLQICESERGVAADNSEKEQWLKLSGLVVNDHCGHLQVANAIYRRIFDQRWIDRELSGICSYAPALLEWIQTGKQDDRLLLQGEVLDEAIVQMDRRLAKGLDVGLGNIDFIQRSKDRRTDLKLQAQQLELDKSAAELGSQRQQIGRLLVRLRRLLLAGAAVGIMLAMILGYYAIENSNHDTTIKFGRISRQISEQYEFAPLEMLEAAITNADEFRKSPVPKNSPYATFTPQLALQKIVDRIQEVDKINTYQQEMTATHYCQDGRVFTAGLDGTIKLWDTNSGKETSWYSGIDRASITSLSFSQANCRGGRFAYGDRFGRVYLGNIDDQSGSVNAEQEVWGGRDRNELLHDGPLRGLQLTRDGRYLITVGQNDGLLKVWSIDQENQLQLRWSQLAHEQKDPEGNRISVLALNNTQNRIGTAGYDGTAKVWDLNGKLLYTLAAAPSNINSLHFCPEKCTGGASLVTGDSDSSVRIWEPRGQQIGSLKTRIGEVTAVRFSPDGQSIATATLREPSAINGNSVRIWRLVVNGDRQIGGHLLADFRSNDGAANDLHFNPDRQELFTSSRENSTIKVWQIPQIIGSPHLDKINSVRFDPRDSRYFITASNDNSIRWWRHDPDQSSIVSVDEYKVDGKKFSTIRFHPNLGRRMIAVGDRSGNISLLKVEHDRLKLISSFPTKRGEVYSIDWNYQPYGENADRYLLGVATKATNSNDNNAQIKESFSLWEIDVAKGERVGTQPLKLPETFNHRQLSIRFSEDGQNLALAGDLGFGAIIRDVNSSDRRVMRWPTKDSTDRRLSKIIIVFDHDSKHIAAVGTDGKINLANLPARLDAPPTSIDSKPIDTYQFGTTNAAFSRSRDDRSIATAGSSAAVRIWDFQGRQRADYRSYWGDLKSMDFSKDDKYILVGGDDGIPRVWQVERNLDDLINAGCRWLSKSYLHSHGRKIDPAICPSSLTPLGKHSP